MSKTIGFIKHFLNGLTGIMFVLCICWLIVLYGGGLLGIQPYVVVSGSMEPQIETGSLCFVNTNYAFDQVRQGDIIAFALNNGSLVTHRVVSITTSGLETKGDSNEVSDGITTTRANYKGKTLGSIPKAGFLIEKIQTLRGKIIFMAAGIFIILVNMIVSKTEFMI